MLERFLLNKEPIISCLALLGTNSYTMNLSGADWAIIKYSVEILKVFDEVTKEVSSEKTVSLSKTGVLCRLMARQITTYKQKKNKGCPPRN